MLSPVLLLALLGGLLPALLWLFFWLMEDRCEPEPRRYLFFTFLAGMFVVFMVLPVERTACALLSGLGGCPARPTFAIILAWAFIEELFKFGAAYLVALRARVFDEPLDAVIYMVTVALGFAALENALFLLSPLYGGDMLRGVLTGNLRFIGATLLHVLSSATIGLALALAYYKPAAVRRMAALAGVILATSLHALFNFFILEKGSGATYMVFLCIWIGIVALLFMIERIKDPKKDYC